MQNNSSSKISDGSSCDTIRDGVSGGEHFSLVKREQLPLSYNDCYCVIVGAKHYSVLGFQREPGYVDFYEIFLYLMLAIASCF